MIFSYPEYMESFRCLASKCTDNCCIGWEIDIDRDALEEYKSLKLSGKRLIDSTENNGECHFAMEESGRCPFLDENNLCRIITHYGKEAIPEICREHPRYYTEAEGYTECGIGLSCEEAARIILTSPLPITLTQKRSEDKDGDGISPVTRVCLEYRSELFEALFKPENDGLSVAKSVLQSSPGAEARCFSAMTGAKESEETDTGENEQSLKEDLQNFLRLITTLEALDKAHTERIEQAAASLEDEYEGFIRALALPENDGYFKRLLFYFLHRYLLCGAWELTLNARAKMSVYSALTVMLLHHLSGAGREKLLLIARQYSKSIEYSTVNVDEIVDALS